MPESPHHGNHRSEQPANKLLEFIVLLLVTFAAFPIGSYFAWTSAALPLYREDSTLTIDSEQGSWIGALLPFGAALGTMPARTIADKLGRKISIWFMTLPLFLCWFVIAYGSSEGWIYLARLVAGAASGAVSVVIPMYVSEIVEASAKECLGTILQLQITLGILYAYISDFTGNLLNIAMLCAVIPGFLLIAFPFMPESPAWLISKDRRKEADHAIRRLRGRDYPTEDVLTRLEETRLSHGDRIGILDLAHYTKATVIAVGSILFQQLSGAIALIFYARTIFEKAETTLDPSVCSLIFGIVQVLAAYVSTTVIDRAGRKILLFISASVMAVCMFVLSGYFRFKAIMDVSDYDWVPVLAFVVFIGIFGVGFGPIPWLIVAEVFPNNARIAARTLMAFVNWTLAFLVIKCFQDMIDWVGRSTTFATFGVMSLMGTLFVAVLVPETKGKTFEEVQIELYGIRDEDSKSSKSRV